MLLLVELLACFTTTPSREDMVRTETLDLDTLTHLLDQVPAGISATILTGAGAQRSQGGVKMNENIRLARGGLAPLRTVIELLGGGPDPLGAGA